jgi:hypothetical protein
MEHFPFTISSQTSVTLDQSPQSSDSAKKKKFASLRGENICNINKRDSKRRRRRKLTVFAPKSGKENKVNVKSYASSRVRYKAHRAICSSIETSRLIRLCFGTAFIACFATAGAVRQLRHNSVVSSGKPCHIVSAAIVESRYQRSTCLVSPGKQRHTFSLCSLHATGAH